MPLPKGSGICRSKQKDKIVLVDRGQVLGWWVKGLGVMLASSLSFAQDSGSLSSLKPAAEQRIKVETPQKKSGRLLMVVFREGLPVPHFRLTGSFGEIQTDEDGAWVGEVPEGSHELRWPEVEEPARFQVQAGGETLLRLQVLGPKAELELQAPQTRETPDSTALRETVRVQLELQATEGTESLQGARVRLVGSEQEWVFEETQGPIELPLGEVEILVLHPRYQALHQKLNLQKDPSPLVLKLQPARDELEEFVVLAPKNKGSVAALVEIRRQSAAVSEVLGSEQMSRAGDSDAAASLRRVTGLTLVGGKYVYVRGLGERYSAVQMNNLGLPSPEPARRVVPLDLFPTAVLESVVVQKSFTPDLPAEFGGGLIQLKSKSLPDRFFARVSLSQSFDDVSDRLSYQGGRSDQFGRDDGTRRLPGEIRSALGSGRRLLEKTSGTPDGFTPEELQAMGRSLTGAYDVSRRSDPLPPGLTVALGQSWKPGDVKFGASGALLASQSGDVGEKKSASFNVESGSTLVQDKESLTEYSEVERKFAGSFDAGMELGENHRLSVSLLGVLDSNDSVEIKSTRLVQDAQARHPRQTRLEWVERDLVSRQFQGRHKVSGLELEWRVAQADARRLKPDERETVYLWNGSRYELSLDATGNRRVFEELKDRSEELGFDLSLPVSWVGGAAKFKVGANRQSKQRGSDVYRLHFKNRFAASEAPDFGANPGAILGNPQNIKPDGFVLTNLTESADSYQGEQKIEALYGLTEFELGPQWSVLTGARLEQSRQEVRTFYYFDRTNPTSGAGLEMVDVLPATSLSWKPDSNWKARLAYSETLARPDFRELSTVPFIDDESGYEAVGNSQLRGTVIQNWDHRWEYYFNPDEFASVGVFLKRFESPIEEIFEPSPNLRKTFANAQAAENRGLELETRMSLRRFSRDLRRWTLLTNVSLIESKIQLGEEAAGIQTTSNRPLQGQSPYVVNFQLQYDRPVEGFTGTVLYNVIGPRITEVGTNARPDVYEQPFGQLDLVMSKKFNKVSTLGLRVRNLLDPEAVSLQGGETVKSQRKGRSISISLSAQL